MSPRPQLLIRFARSDDLPAVHDLIRDLAEYERLGHTVVSTVADLHDVLFGTDAFVEAIVAEIESRVIGFALFYRTYSTFAGCTGLYLEDLFVRQDERGRGIGRQLLASLAAITTERGYARIDWSVLGWNEPSIRFYEALGALRMEEEEWGTFRLTGEPLRCLADAAATSTP